MYSRIDRENVHTREIQCGLRNIPCAFRFYTELDNHIIIINRYGNLLIFFICYSFRTNSTFSLLFEQCIQMTSRLPCRASTNQTKIARTHFEKGAQI